MRSLLYAIYIIARWLPSKLGLMRWIENSAFFRSGARWLRERIIGNQYVEIVEKMDSHRLLINSDYIDLLKKGIHEKGTTEMFINALSNDSNVIDIGANIGYYSLLAAKRIGPSGKVYAFEPEPDNYNILLKNISLNGYQNITAIRKAISNRTEAAKLYLNPRGYGWHSMIPSGAKNEKIIEIETITLDDFCTSIGNPVIHVIKLDVEGWELEALRGMEQTIKRNETIRLFVEFYPVGLLDRKLDPMQLIDTLLGLDLHIYLIDDESGHLTKLQESQHQALADLVKSHKTSINFFCAKL